MGVHAIDGMIDLCGPIDTVYCQSFRRVVPVDADDTTSMLFRMKEGMSGYLGTMTATGPGFSVVDQASGAYSGFDVDYCKAVATAILGDPEAVNYVEKHDNETLWDLSQYKHPAATPTTVLPETFSPMARRPPSSSTMGA